MVAGRHKLLVSFEFEIIQPCYTSGTINMKRIYMCMYYQDDVINRINKYCEYMLYDLYSLLFHLGVYRNRILT